MKKVIIAVCVLGTGIAAVIAAVKSRTDKYASRL